MPPWARLQGEPVTNEILCRNDATVQDVDKKQRIVTVLAVPWEQEAEIIWRGETWREVFTRGAFNGLENSAGRIRVNREHTKGDTIGRVVRADPADPQGLIMDVKVARTTRGDDTLALAEEEMISASVGYWVKQPSDVAVSKNKMLRRVNRAFLDHLSFVESPAYEGAKVLGVRVAPDGLTVVETPLPETPTLDEFLNDDLLKWARNRKSSV
jgi:HK97 family phage prohead protease